jgi:hypothetical protein
MLRYGGKTIAAGIVTEVMRDRLKFSLTNFPWSFVCSCVRKKIDNFSLQRSPRFKGKLGMQVYNKYFCGFGKKLRRPWREINV